MSNAAKKQAAVAPRTSGALMCVHQCVRKGLGGCGSMLLLHVSTSYVSFPIDGM